MKVIEIWYYIPAIKSLNTLIDGGLCTLCSIIINLHRSLKETTHRYPLQSTLEADQFITPDFTFSTSSSYIVHVTSDGSEVDVSCSHIYLSQQRYDLSSL